MQSSGVLYAMIRRFEGIRLSAYKDIGGKLTIGYGSTRNVTAGMTINLEDAEKRLAEDVKSAEADVNRLVRVPLTQSQYDALVDFVFNLGGLALSGSTLLLKLNAKDYKGAADEFLRWDHQGGKVVAGLSKRRVAERELFLRTGAIVA